jgi:protein TonB
VNDPVDKLLQDREAMDRGFSGGVILSVGAHVAVVVGSFAVAFLTPAEPLIKVMDGMAVVELPKGGGGVPNPPRAAPAPAKPEPVATPAPEPEPPKPEPPKPQIIKPPREAPKKGLPELDAKKSKKKATPTPAPVPRSGGVAGATGTATQTPGLAFGPPGPGSPTGTSDFGDFYLAGVQRKIWMLWTQQIRTEQTAEVVVRFTILADGSVADVTVVQSSNISLIDRAAQRAVLTAAPFGPLPKTYGTDRFTIQAAFRPQG